MLLNNSKCSRSQVRDTLFLRTPMYWAWKGTETQLYCTKTKSFIRYDHGTSLEARKNNRHFECQQLIDFATCATLPELRTFAQSTLSDALFYGLSVFNSVFWRKTDLEKRKKKESAFYFSFTNQNYEIYSPACKLRYCKYGW